MDISIVDKKCSSIPSNVLKHYKTLEILQSDVPNVQISKYNKYNTAKQSTPQISKTIQQNTAKQLERGNVSWLIAKLCLQFLTPSFSWYCASCFSLYNSCVHLQSYMVPAVQSGTNLNFWEAHWAPTSNKLGLQKCGAQFAGKSVRVPNMPGLNSPKTVAMIFALLRKFLNGQKQISVRHQEANCMF